MNKNIKVSKIHVILEANIAFFDSIINPFPINKDV